MLTDAQEQVILGVGGRTGLIDINYRWPDNTVVYEFNTEPFSAAHIEQILQGMREIEAISCIRFKERTNEEDYVQINVRNNRMYIIFTYIDEKFWFLGLGQWLSLKCWLLEKWSTKCQFSIERSGQWMLSIGHNYS